MYKQKISQRLRKDFNDIIMIMKNNDDINKDDVYVENNVPFEEMTQPNNFSVILRGPSGTPYSGGKFILQLEVPAEYPFRPPKVKFGTKIYHPNINDTSKSICLDILGNNWNPSLSLTHVILSVSALLDKPNPNDPLVADIGGLYKNDFDKFMSNAVEYTKTHAIKDENRNYLN
jgi:ubiquitin-protein ligase